MHDLSIWLTWHEQEEDTVSVLATVERAIAAGVTAAATAAAATANNPWPAESYTSRRNPKQFAFAEVQ